MKSIKILAIVLTGLLTLLVFSTVYSVSIQESIQDQMSTSSQEFSSAVTIPYHGNLTDEGGKHVTDGIYAFIFSIYEDHNQDEPVWSELQEEVEVENSVFTVQLGSVKPLPTISLQNDQLLLHVAVRGQGDDTFITLNPPQVLQSNSASNPESTSAQAACAHDHLGETWSTHLYSIQGLTIEQTEYGHAFKATTTSDAYDGVDAVILGENLSGDVGPGVKGKGWIGVSGSGSCFGVSGYGPCSGVLGEGSGTTGHGGSFYGANEHLDLLVGGDIGRINASSYDGSQLWLSSNADIFLILDNDGGENHALHVQASGGVDACTINESGDLWCAGTISEGASTAQYGERLLYPIGSPEVLFEDFGTGTLENGAAHIEFEQIFAETVNLGENYHVFLTPVCDQPLVLNVSAKTPSGFSVQGVTLDGTPSNCKFDYRIVAKRLGYESLRLEQVSTDLKETP
ncbi:hypothetical protein ACFLUA_05060 [Chloroflexota bacterium]